MRISKPLKRARLPNRQVKTSCDYGLDFSFWATEIFEKTDLSDSMKIYEALIMLVIQYYNWYQQVPRAHQVMVGSQGHTCIFHVFMELLDILMQARLALDPPIYVPPPPPPEIRHVKVPVPMVVDYDEESGKLLGLDIGLGNEIN
jgi:hypothetical protein